MTEAELMDTVEDEDAVVIVEEEEDNNEEVTDEVTEDVTDEKDNEEVVRLREELAKAKAEKAKAEKAIVDLKRNSKKPKEATQWEFLTKQDLDIIRHIDSNPELVGYEEDLKSYMEKWLNLSQATLLLKSENEVLKNRQTVNQMSVTWWESGSTKTTYSTADLEKLSWKEYNRVMNLIDSWKAIRKG